MHLKVIYNPTAGRGRVRRRMPEVEEQFRALGATVELYATTSADDLARAAAEASRDASVDRVVICGGDGSVHHAVRDFDLERGTFAMLPLGSGDDFATVCNVPKDLGRACEIAVRGAVREVDVALANGIRYLGVAGLGFDSEVNEYANTIHYLGGSFVYVYATLRLLPRFQPHRVSIDGAPPAPIMFAAVGNSRQYGGGIRITPDAKIDDGLLDACIVGRTSRWQLLLTMPRAYTGAHVKKSFVEVRRAREFAFDAERPLKVYGDGEYMTTTPVKFGLEATRLRVVTGHSPRQ
ncbi:MAG TPA: diacylglycerol kinase family protein [Thermoanaerobaculia bacterium]|nr:diacylglycerol kinase family protein [Thermoanaerobaculia bacterium]